MVPAVWTLRWLCRYVVSAGFGFAGWLTRLPASIEKASAFGEREGSEREAGGADLEGGTALAIAMEACTTSGWMDTMRTMAESALAGFPEPSLSRP